MVGAATGKEPEVPPVGYEERKVMRSTKERVLLRRARAAEKITPRSIDICRAEENEARR